MDRPALWLLPGTLCDETLWEHQARFLSEDADVVVGSLTKGASVQEMARHLLASAPPQFALAGLSLGGIVAMEMIRQAPERIFKLALLDTSPNPANPPQIETWEAYMNLAATGRFMDITEQFLLPLLIHPNRLQDEVLPGKIKSMAEHIGPETFMNQARAVMSKPDSWASLKSISCPTLVLTGRQDALCSLELHEKMAAAIPGSKLVVIENCGHLSTMEQPDSVTDALRNWLLNKK